MSAGGLKFICSAIFLLICLPAWAGINFSFSNNGKIELPKLQTMREAEIFGEAAGMQDAVFDELKRQLEEIESGMYIPKFKQRRHASVWAGFHYSNHKLYQKLKDTWKDTRQIADTTTDVFERQKMGELSDFYLEAIRTMDQLREAKKHSQEYTKYDFLLKAYSVAKDKYSKRKAANWFSSNIGGVPDFIRYYQYAKNNGLLSLFSREDYQRLRMKGMEYKITIPQKQPQYDRVGAGFYAGSRRVK